MDPLTICATVAGLVKTCGTAATTCNGLLSKYKNAPEILVSIRTECTAIKTTLSFVERLVKQDTKLLSSQLKAYSPLAETLDVALSGCAFTFSILDIELQKLYDRSKSHDGYSWKDKMRYLWDEDRVKDVLLHMRGLQSAVNLMLTALQTASVSPLVSLPQDQKSVIERVRQDTASICENRSLQLGLTANADEQASSENYSIFDSTFGDEIFSFDDEIVNSFAYRNALKRLASKKKATQQNKKPDEHHILDEPLIDLEGPSETNNGPRIKFTVTSNYPCLTPSKPFTHTVDLSDTVAEDLKSLLPNSVASPIQQRNERHAHFTSPSYSGGNPNNTSANQSDKSRDGKKGIGQVFGAGRSDVLRSSMLSKKESSSLHDEEKKRAKSVIEQAVPDDSRIAFPFPRILSVNGNINTYHSNGARVDLGSTQAKTEAPHDYAASRRRRWIERSLGAIPSSSPILGLKSLDDGKYGGQYGHESRTKASEDEGIFCDKPITEHDYTNDEIIEYDRASKEAVKNIEMKPRRKTSQGQQSGLRAYASLVDNSATKGGDGVASKSSINANLRLLETVENSIRRLIMPELETLRQEQRKEQSSQTPEPSHRGSRASPVTNANLSHKSSKYASDSDASEDLELSRDEDKSDVCEDVDLTTDIPRAVERTSNSIAEDGKPVTIPTRKRRSSRDKSRGDCDLTHGLQRSQTSLLIEYFEGGRGTDSHSRPSVKVKLSSARISRSKT